MPCFGRLPLPDDHAFANGAAFPEPANLLAACARARGLRAGLLLSAVWRQFRAGASLGDGVWLSLRARLINLSAGAVRIGDRAVLRGTLRVEPGGALSIGRDVYVGDDVILSAGEGIDIGEGTLIAHGVQVFDNDTHPLDATERLRHFRMIRGLETGRIRIATAPVRIGARAWIGLNCLIMKGVTIGDDTVVAAGSVVTRDLPAGVVAVGNPARPISEAIARAPG
jgi:acetyltransferase-like isoleucine patch superfamily enzyme